MQFTARFSECHTSDVTFEKLNADLMLQELNLTR